MDISRAHKRAPSAAPSTSTLHEAASTSRKRTKGTGVGGPGRAGAGGALEQVKDVVLVSSDNHRFPFSSRRLLATSPLWETLLPSSPSLPPSVAPLSLTDVPTSSGQQIAASLLPFPAVVPEVYLPESGACLKYVLRFLERKPVQARKEWDDEGDWEVVRAMERFSIWRGIDAYTALFSVSPLPNPLLAPAFAFSLLFSLPALTRSIALQAAKRCSVDPEAVATLRKGLERAGEEWEVDQGEVARLLSYLLHRSTSLHALRLSSLSALSAFDADYDCEHACRGMLYSRLVGLLSTTSRKKARKMAREEGVFDCKDCDTRWDVVVEKVVEGLEKIPECPFPAEVEEEGSEHDDGEEGEEMEE